LPEITEDALAEEINGVGITDGQGPFWKQYRCVFGFVAQTAYVWVHLILLCGESDNMCSGAQVTVASFAVNFLVDQGVGIDPSKASQLFSFCQITFTVGR
jgi:FHS family L-fucose permease-like MFS transporter